MVHAKGAAANLGVPYAAHAPLLDPGHQKPDPLLLLRPSGDGEAGWFGHIAVEWFEDTEWRKRLRADAEAASKAREDAEAKAKKKDEKPEPKTDGSTKKRVAKKTD